jgi:Fe-S oxidoreductase
LDVAVSNCLACKGCTPECPSNVNLALLKAEMTYARHCRDGLPVRERILSNADLLGRIGCVIPTLANAIVDSAPMRTMMEKALGLSAKRSLPHYAKQRFDWWFEKHNDGADRAPLRKRGKVIVWDDTFVRYNEPYIGIAAVKVLEALGFEVALAQDRQCCGRPAFSQGNLDYAAELGNHNVDLLLSAQPFNGSTSQQSAPPILFLEPSCYSMFAEDYRELKIPKAEELAKRCFLFEKFVDDLLVREPNALRFQDRQEHVVIHAHCHAKSLLSTGYMARLVERLPGRSATLLDTGCCGMAGAFGMLAEKYDLSVQVAADLLGKIGNQPSGATVIASGTSCRHQISDLSDARPKHMAELIADAMV